MTSATKIAIFVGAIFLSLGIYLPFFPLWLETKDFSSAEIAFLLSVPLAVKVVFTPFLTASADRFPARRQAAITYCFMTLIVFSAIALFDGFWAMLILLALFGAFWHALIPLGDSFALTEVRLHGANYGAMRLWGSITFVLANLGAGYWLGSVDQDFTHSLIVIMLALALLAAFLLPAYGVPVKERPKAGLTLSNELGSFFKNKHFMAMAMSAGLLQSSHALLYGFGTIDWIARGYSTREIGAFWAIGVIAEIILFTQARRLFKWVKPQVLLLFGGGAAIMRWGLHGDVDGFILILTLQCLHGLTFGATHLGMQSFIAGHVSERQTPAAQGAMLLVAGVMMAGLTLLCGMLYSHFAGGAFIAMAAISFIGLIPLLLLRYPQRSGEGG